MESLQDESLSVLRLTSVFSIASKWFIITADIDNLFCRQNALCHRGEMNPQESNWAICLEAFRKMQGKCGQRTTVAE